MKINNIQNNNLYFGVHLDKLGKDVVNEREQQIVNRYGIKTQQYRQFCRQKKEIDELFPSLYLWTQTTPYHIGTIGLVKNTGEYYAGIAISDIDFDVLYGFLKYIDEGDKRHSYVWGTKEPIKKTRPQNIKLQHKKKTSVKKTSH